jgi:phenylacetate-CoA ligase
MRAAHLNAVRAGLKDHIARLDWSRQRIERYQNWRPRSLLAFARERSAFHARRLGGLDPSRASVADLASLPMMTKRDAQEQWDAIVTGPDLDRERAERTLAEQQWFSYTPGGEQIFSSGGSGGVRGVDVWDWRFFVSAACLAWRTQAREELRAEKVSRRARLAVLEAGVPPHASTPLFDVPSAPGMETLVIAADIVVVGDPDRAALISALVAALRRYGLPEPAIRIQATESLRRHQASGKLRRFMPL